MGLPGRLRVRFRDCFRDLLRIRAASDFADQGIHPEASPSRGGIAATRGRNHRTGRRPGFPVFVVRVRGARSYGSIAHSRGEVSPRASCRLRRPVMESGENGRGPRTAAQRPLPRNGLDSCGPNRVFLPVPAGPPREPLRVGGSRDRTRVRSGIVKKVSRRTAETVSISSARGENRNPPGDSANSINGVRTRSARV